MRNRFNAYLEYYVILAKNDKKIAKSIPTVPANLEIDLPELTRLDAVHKGIEDFYINEADGYGYEWWTETGKRIAGKLQFVATKYLFADPKDSGLYDEGDEEERQYFHILDNPNPESSVGFIIKPDTIYKSLYYLSGDYEIYNLDLDYSGYTQMAVEARVFNHWQVVLLYYMGTISIGSSETETFKTEMPKIFTDWTWENFIKKFENLRLSKNN